MDFLFVFFCSIVKASLTLKFSLHRYLLHQTSNSKTTVIVKFPNHCLELLCLNKEITHALEFEFHFCVVSFFNMFGKIFGYRESSLKNSGETEL